MSDQRPLHRLFGLTWIDFFQGTSVEVETELDLSLKKQFLDVVLIRRGTDPITRPLPDGFQDLAAHNLVSFKSHQESLDGWALCELIGHYVNYRKQVSPSLDELLPQEDFRLYGVCARLPQNLFRTEDVATLQQGVFELRVMTHRVRLVVVRELPLENQNAMLHLFSAREDQLRFGKEFYRPHSRETSTLLYNLFMSYREDLAMSEKLKEFVRQSIRELLDSLPPEERMIGLPAEVRLKGLPAEERLKGLPAEERLKGLSPEEVFRALPPDTLEALIRRLKAEDPPDKE